MIAIGVPAEEADESRIGLSPETVKKLIKLGAKVKVRAGAGLRSHFSDADYSAAGASMARSDADAVSDADVVLTVRRPSLALVKSSVPTLALPTAAPNVSPPVRVGFVVVMASVP